MDFIVFAFLGILLSLGKESHNALAVTGSCLRPGLYADPNDCTKFYMCASYGPIKFDCPEGLDFSPTLLVCDWPETAGCTLRKSYATSTTPSSTTISTINGENTTENFHNSSDSSTHSLPSKTFIGSSIEVNSTEQVNLRSTTTEASTGFIIFMTTTTEINNITANSYTSKNSNQTTSENEIHAQDISEMTPDEETIEPVRPNVQTSETTAAILRIVTNSIRNQNTEDSRPNNKTTVVTEYSTHFNNEDSTVTSVRNKTAMKEEEDVDTTLPTSDQNYDRSSFYISFGSITTTQESIVSDVSKEVIKNVTSKTSDQNSEVLRSDSTNTAFIEHTTSSTYHNTSEEHTNDWQEILGSTRNSASNDENGTGNGSETSTENLNDLITGSDNDSSDDNKSIKESTYQSKTTDITMDTSRDSYFTKNNTNTAGNINNPGTDSYVVIADTDSDEMTKEIEYTIIPGTPADFVTDNPHNITEELNSASHANFEDMMNSVQAESRNTEDFLQDSTIAREITDFSMHLSTEFDFSKDSFDIYENKQTSLTPSSTFVGNEASLTEDKSNYLMTASSKNIVEDAVSMITTSAGTGSNGSTIDNRNSESYIKTTSDSITTTTTTVNDNVDKRFEEDKTAEYTRDETEYSKTIITIIEENMESTTDKAVNQTEFPSSETVNDDDIDTITDTWEASHEYYRTDLNHAITEEQPNSTNKENINQTNPSPSSNPVDITILPSYQTESVDIVSSDIINEEALMSETESTYIETMYDNDVGTASSLISTSGKTLIETSYSNSKTINDEATENAKEASSQTKSNNLNNTVTSSPEATSNETEYFNTVTFSYIFNQTKSNDQTYLVTKSESESENEFTVTSIKPDTIKTRSSGYNQTSVSISGITTPTNTGPSDGVPILSTTVNVKSPTSYINEDLMFTTTVVNNSSTKSSYQLQNKTYPNNIMESSTNSMNVSSSVIVIPTTKTTETIPLISSAQSAAITDDQPISSIISSTMKTSTIIGKLPTTIDSDVVTQRITILMKNNTISSSTELNNITNQMTTTDIISSTKINVSNATPFTSLKSTTQNIASATMPLITTSIREKIPNLTSSSSKLPKTTIQSLTTNSSVTNKNYSSYTQTTANITSGNMTSSLTNTVSTEQPAISSTISVTKTRDKLPTLQLITTTSTYENTTNNYKGKDNNVDNHNMDHNSDDINSFVDYSHESDDGKDTESDKDSAKDDNDSDDTSDSKTSNESKVSKDSQVSNDSENSDDSSKSDDSDDSRESNDSDDSSQSDDSDDSNQSEDSDDSNESEDSHSNDENESSESENYLEDVSNNDKNNNSGDKKSGDIKNNHYHNHRNDRVNHNSKENHRNTKSDDRYNWKHINRDGNSNDNRNSSNQRRYDKNNQENKNNRNQKNHEMREREDDRNSGRNNSKLKSNIDDSNRKKLNEIRNEQNHESRDRKKHDKNSQKSREIGKNTSKRKRNGNKRNENHKRRQNNIIMDRYGNKQNRIYWLNERNSRNERSINLKRYMKKFMDAKSTNIKVEEFNEHSKREWMKKIENSYQNNIAVPQVQSLDNVVSQKYNNHKSDSGTQEREFNELNNWDKSDGDIVFEQNNYKRFLKKMLISKEEKIYN